MATIKDIAQACGVSLMTVSRALRENSPVKESTRKRILEEAERQGYTNTARQGRPASAEPPRQVQLILGNINGSMYYFHMRLLTALEQQLAACGYECIIRTTNGSYNIFLRIIERIKRSRCAGTILFGSFEPEQLETLLLALPGALLLDNHVRESFSGAYSSFSFNNRKAAYLAVKHLISRGRKRVALVTGPKEHFFTREMCMGYQEALSEAGIKFDPALIIHTDFLAAGAADGLRNLLSQHIDLDSVATNDEMATGVYRVLQERHLRIPDDVAICGCDNLPIGEQLYPELTTIILDYQDLASAAIKHIISGKSKQVRQKILLEPQLLIKSST
ncbi:MAG: LacI family DNA-binding transcriptional regulator [Lentisphaeria bacterium]|nr:LacI family DNA-binding transcriptional regulator [Lentisphaeria bacterium]